MPSLGTRVKATQQKFVSRLLSQRENIIDDPFLEILKICVAAQTKRAKYLERLMCSGDVVQYDLVQRHDAVLRRANDYSDGNKGTKFRTYIISINPNGTIHPMYIRNAVSVPDRDRLWAPG